MSGFCKCVNALWSKLRRHSAAGLMLVIALGAGAASAQELSADERAKLLAQKEALFQQMLRDPGNLDIMRFVIARPLGSQLREWPRLRNSARLNGTLEYCPKVLSRDEMIMWQL